MKLMARQGMMVIAVAVFVSALTGCPLLGRPSLSVQPVAVSLSDSKLTEQISLTNTGSGMLNWTAEVSVPWLRLSLGDDPPESVITGSTANIAIFRVHLVREALPEDSGETLRTEIQVRSNGGERNVSVAVTSGRNPMLAIEPEVLDFGDTDTEKLVEVLNRGEAVLQWEAIIPPGLDWLTITPTLGAVGRTSAEGLTVRINRSRLVPSAAPYRVEIVFESNGGTKVLGISVEAPAFTAMPRNIEFGLLRQPQTSVVSLQTYAASPVALVSSVTYTEGNGWLTLSPENVSITATQPADLRITANPIDLVPGLYTASVAVTHPDTGRIATIPVSMEVGVPVNFRVDPAFIDLGDVREEVQRTAMLINEGGEAIEWRVEKASPAPWLTVTPEEGLLDDTVEVTVTADPALLRVAAHGATLIFYAGGVSRTLRVTLNRLPDPIPDALEVEPRELDFGATLNRLEMNIWNDGPSRIDWTIDAASLPAWLSADRLSGSVEGRVTQTVFLDLDRALAPDEEFFSHTLVVTPSGVVGLGPVEVQVRAQQRRYPEIVITGDGVDAANIPFIMIDIGQDSRTFVVRNEGNADLNWRVVLDGLPGWITSVNPTQGVLQPGRERTVQVTTNRVGLGQSGGNHRIAIESNDPEVPVASLDVQVRVPFSIVIGARPSSLNFGRTLSTLGFEVANLGDAGWPLDFVVTASQPEWILVEPERGRSIGTGSDFKNWQFVSVAIDRSRIPGTGAAGKLIISAENVPQNAYPVTPIEIPISVDVAELTVQAAFPRFRPPSLLRFNMLLRDSRQRVFPEFVDNPLDAQTLVRLDTVRAQILEDNVPIDLSETNVIIKKDETLSFAVLVMLDYSASMLEAAQALVADGQLDPGGMNPLEALYIETIGAMLDEFPEHYQVALGVFNERRPFWESDVRIIRGAPLGYGLKASFDAFTADKDIQRHRLLNMDVWDNGATPLYPAIGTAALLLNSLDDTLPDFDAVANRIIVTVTDGRRTTPPGDLSALLDLLYETRVRVFPIGWGKNVIANPLIQMSTESGGHYYATRSRLVPGELDANGNPLMVPLKDSLLDRARQNPADLDISSVPRDLSAHVVVSYVTLNEEDSMDVQARMEVETVIPSVKETIIFSQVPALTFANDVRLGQIGMRTEGISGGAATVRFYADYAPRNITRMVFDIDTDPALSWSVVQVPAEQGGLIADWGITRVGNRITVQSLTGRPMAYGDYGNLFDIVVTGVAAPFTLTVNVVEPVIGVHPDSKYFTIPESIPVGDGPFVAVSFPNPEFEFTPPAVSEISNIFDLGSLDALPEEDRNLSVLVTNIGGEHLPTFATLYWVLRQGDGYLPGTRPGVLEFEYNGPEPIDFDYYLIHNADTGTIIPVDIYDELGDVVAEPGTYSSEFYIDVYYGTLMYLFSHGPYYVRYDVP